MKEASPVKSIMTVIKSQDEALVAPSVEILKRMYTEEGYGIDVLHGIQDHFLGPYKNQKTLTLSDMASLTYERRVRFLYVLDKLIREDPDIQKSLNKLKKETGPKKLGVSANDMVRRMAFLWAAIEREK